jgi:Holliday junction resolvasome RuvABC endonuclease subunit
MSIDPGIAGTGWALWRPQKDDPQKYGSISVHNKTQWNQRAVEVAERVGAVAVRNSVEVAYVEEPAFMQSAGGQVTAASGSLVKLAFTVGCICSRLESLEIDAILVPVRDWKGQLSKETVEDRLRRIFPNLADLKAPTHVFDAIGIGLHAMGRSINEVPKM